MVECAYPCQMGDSRIQRVWVRRPRSMWRLVLGWFCIGLGVVGVLVPILPGIPLLIIGLVLLSTQYHWAHRAMVWMKARFHRKPAQR